MSMKKIFALLLALLLPCTALAAEIKTEALSLTLPDSWTYDVSEEGNISMVSPFGALVALTVLDATDEEAKKDLDPESVAVYLCEQLRESGAKATDVTKENGIFTFTAGDRDSVANPASIFRFSIEKNKWFVMVIIQATDLGPVEKILASVRYN